jgi:putative ABC transport system permease protein
VQQTISTMGSNLFIVLSGSFTTAGVRSGSAGAPTLNVADGEAIAELDGVANVAPTHQGTRQLVYGSQNWSSQVIGTTPEYSRRGPGTLSAAPASAIPTCARRRGWRSSARRWRKPVRRRRPDRQDHAHPAEPFIVIGVLGSKGRTSMAATRTTP